MPAGELFLTRPTTWWNGAAWKGTAALSLTRLSTGSPPANKTRQIHTPLVVIKLDKERSAVIGHAEGANEEAKARAIADKAR